MSKEKREIAIKELEKREVKNDLKIEKLEVKLRILKDEQDQIIETFVKLMWRKEVTLLSEEEREISEIAELEE